MAVGVVTTRDPIADGLSWSFHDESCPPLEDIVDFYVAKAFRLDGTTPIHMCDASLLLNGTDNEQLEGPNLTLCPVALQIDNIRTAVHHVCKPIVSCAVEIGRAHV